jgi:hypothetical protein
VQRKITVHEGGNFPGRVNGQVLGSAALAAIDIYVPNFRFELELSADRQNLAPVSR